VTDKKDDLEHLQQFLFKDLDFCGCGDPESVYELIRELLELFRLNTEEIRKPRENPFSLADILNGPNYRQQIRDLISDDDGVYYAFLYWLDSAGVLEHGGSVGGSWLTRKGFHYLELMKAREYREMEGNSCIMYGFPHGGEPCGPGCSHWEASYDEWEKKDLTGQGRK
jgi:hypothetical protein